MDLDDFIAEMSPSASANPNQQQTSIEEDGMIDEERMVDTDADGVGDVEADGSSSFSVEQGAALLAEIRGLESQLKQASSTSSGPSGNLSSHSYTRHKQLFQLRKSLRRAYLTYIDGDPLAAHALELESRLWKDGIYKQIEAFRKLIKQFANNGGSSGGGSGGGSAIKKNANQWQRYQQFYTLTRAFIRECTRTYDRLFFKHLAYTDFDAIPSVTRKQADTECRDDVAVNASLRLPHITLQPKSLPSSSSSSLVVLPHDTRQIYLHSCHRSLICRGDLERYAQLIDQDEAAQHAKRTPIADATNTAAPGSDATSVTPPFKPNWSRVERFYSLATSLIPSIGNPWNQLAVLATYKHDTLLAVYRYFRALSASQPFPTADVNLKLLFDNTIDSTVYASHRAKHADRASLSTPVFTDTPVCGHFLATPWLDFAWVHLFQLLSTPQHQQLTSALPCVANAVLMRFSQQMKNRATFKREFGMRILLNFIYCIHIPPPISIEAPHATTYDSSHSMYDNDLSRPVAPRLISSSAAALTICCEYLSLLMTSLHTGSASSIGIVNTFLHWLAIHPNMIVRMNTMPNIVRQTFIHNLAQLNNVALQHIAGVRPIAPTNLPPDSDDDTSDTPLLPEEEDILGIGVFTNADPSLSSSAVDGVGGLPAGVRRCRRLVDLSSRLTQTTIGLTRDKQTGQFRSNITSDTHAHAPTTTMTTSAPPIALSPNKRVVAPPHPHTAYTPDATPMLVDTPAHASPVHAASAPLSRPLPQPIQPPSHSSSSGVVSSRVVGSHLAAAFSSSHRDARMNWTGTPNRVIVSAFSPTSTILMRAANRPPPGFANDLR